VTRQTSGTFVAQRRRMSKFSLCLLLVFVGCGGGEEVASNDLASSSEVCRSPTGRTCGYSAIGGCPADDGCNWCECEFGSFACTQVLCFDAGGERRCSEKSDCASGQFCVFDPGCNGEAGRCTSVYECYQSGPGSYCGCDGTQFESEGPCPDRPHSGRTC
jgi:hypothetical protein